MSGAGKSTIAIEVERQLFDKGFHVCRLDGDNIRHGLNSNLGFSEEDRLENVRRIAETVRMITLVSVISPVNAGHVQVQSVLHQKMWMRYWRN
ncbi:MAG: adenylyl-sulfate kinase [Lachnospiraceae bacterium]|nr:adenylyl-sulfate kinase [Lachnospiraceae bacterium]